MHGLWLTAHEATQSRRRATLCPSLEHLAQEHEGDRHRGGFEIKVVQVVRFWRDEEVFAQMIEAVDEGYRGREHHQQIHARRPST